VLCTGPKGYRRVSVPDNWNYWNGWNVWNRFPSAERLKRLEQAPLVGRLEPLEPWIEPRRSNGKFFPTIPDDSTGFEIRKLFQDPTRLIYLSQDSTQHLHLPNPKYATISIFKPEPFESPPRVRIFPTPTPQA
jgi:hypothetical protein